MVEFLNDFIGQGYLGEMFENLMDGLIYDNPLIIFFWIYIVGFTGALLCKAIFGG